MRGLALGWHEVALGRKVVVGRPGLEQVAGPACGKRGEVDQVPRSSSAAPRQRCGMPLPGSHVSLLRVAAGVLLLSASAQRAGRSPRQARWQRRLVLHRRRARRGRDTMASHSIPGDAIVPYFPWSGPWSSQPLVPALAFGRSRQKPPAPSRLGAHEPRRLSPSGSPPALAGTRSMIPQACARSARVLA